MTVVGFASPLGASPDQRGGCAARVRPGGWAWLHGYGCDGVVPPLESGTDFLKTVVLDEGELSGPVVGEPNEVVENEEGVFVGESLLVLEHAANPATAVNINTKRIVAFIGRITFRRGV